MNVAPSAVVATEPVSSKGVVAAGAYVDGRRVFDVEGAWSAGLGTWSRTCRPVTQRLN